MSFLPIPGRDASATFAGYIYQVNVTIARWLDLLDGDQLELEAGEDIDTVVAAAHGGLSPKLVEAFTAFGIDPQQHIGGWGLALDSIFDKTIDSLKALLGLLQSAAYACV